MEDETQRHVVLGVTADLAAAGFRDAQTIGRGGFGIVYRCVESGLGRTVAVKLLLEDLASDEDRMRFVREQQAMAKLSGHPNIVDVHQSGVVASGQPFIVMPYCANGGLDGRLRELGTLPDREVLAIGVKLAGALETAHQAGILHRDVKPSNILINDYGEPQLTDFGIAHMTGGFETATGVITGSPAFTAPEVLSGRMPTAQSDIYGLGAVMFCLATGHAVFERKEGEKLIAQFVRVAKEPMPNLREKGLSEALSTVIERAMNPDPAARPSSAAEFGDELRAAEAALGFSPTDMAVPAGTRTTVGRAAPRTERTYSTPPVAVSKYRPPAASGALVDRPRLIDTLRAGGRRRLVLIHGPAGFGKSTLAAQWRAELVRDDVPVIWLTIDDDDNNVVWFVSHLLDAIRKVRPGMGYGLVEMLESGAARAVRSVLNVLLNEIHEAGDDLVLVVDEWHRIQDPQTIAAMATILDDGCHHLRIVTTSRSRAGLPLARLRLHDELVEIDSEALRFDSTEGHAFLSGRGLEEEAFDELLHSTEGWIAALQLASLSLRGGAKPARHRAEDQAIEEYLVENVLDSLDPDLLDSMLAIAITERTCGDLAARLTGAEDGQALLDDIERRELFLRRTDEDWDWMRFQNMFREYLSRRLHTTDPQREVQLHKLASLWFADHDLLNEAIDHALAAGDTDRAADLVEAHREGFLERSAMASLVGVVAKLPRSVVEQRPTLQRDFAWANALLEDSQRALQRVLHDVGATAGINVPEVDVVGTASKGLAKGVGGIRGLMRGLAKSAEPKSPHSDER